MGFPDHIKMTTNTILWPTWPETELRVGRGGIHLLEIYSLFGEIISTASLGEQINYATFHRGIIRPSYLLTLSHKKEGKTRPNKDSEIVLSVTSSSPQRAMAVARYFEYKAGIAFDLPVPEVLRRQYDVLGFVCQSLERNPDALERFFRKSG
jgi:hypothetical protein